MSRAEKIVVSVFGDSGVGKTTFTEALVKRLADRPVCRLHADFFLEDLGERSLVDIRCDFGLIYELLERPAGTELRYPEYDFVKWKRVRREGGLTFTMQNLVILDFMWPYPRADVLVQLELPFERCVERVLKRDPEGWEWRELLKTNWREMRSLTDSEEVKRLPERLILDASRPTEENVERAVRRIEAALPG